MSGHAASDLPSAVTATDDAKIAGAPLDAGGEARRQNMDGSDNKAGH